MDLTAHSESPVTQKMGTATDFRSPFLLETKHFDERKSDGSPHFLLEPVDSRARGQPDSKKYEKSYPSRVAPLPGTHGLGLG